MTSRPAAPESETPEADAVGLALYDLRDLARSLERRLFLAQTEIKGHMRVEDELKAEIARHSRILFAPLGDNHHNAWACPYCNPHIEEQRLKLTQAQSRIAELEKDAARYRWLRREGATQEEALLFTGETMDRFVDAVLKDRA